MAPDNFSESSPAAPPPNPFDEKWYVRSAGETLGPYDGHRVRELLEQGQLTGDSPIARLGATEWSTVRNVPVFAQLGPKPPAGGVPVSVGGVAGQPLAGSVEYAGFWVRFAAYMLDSIFLSLILFGIWLVLGIIGGIAGMIPTHGGKLENEITGAGAGFIALTYLVTIIVAVVYYVRYTSGPWQATPGKRIVRIHVIKSDGGRVGGWRAFGRYLCYIISALPFDLGFFVIGWNDEKKGFHDMICKTRVIYGKL